MYKNMGEYFDDDDEDGSQQVVAAATILYMYMCYVGKGYHLNSQYMQCVRIHAYQSARLVMKLHDECQN